MPSQNEFDYTTKNPQYIEVMPEREMSRTFYNGDLPEVRAYLMQGQYEEPSFYTARQQKIEYKNLLQPIIHARAGLLTRKKPKTTIPASIQAFMDNVDGNHTQAHAFLKQLIIDADVDGIAWCKVDKPIPFGVDATQLSRAAEAELNVRPYLEYVPAKNVIDWAQSPIDRELDWLVVEREKILPRLPGKEQVAIPCWTVWTREEYVTYVEKKEGRKRFYVVDQEQSGPHSLGKVPFVPFYGIKKDPFCGIPFGKQILTQLSRILNVVSQQDHAIEYNNMPRMLVTADGKPDSIPNQNEAFFLPLTELGRGDAKFVESTGHGIEHARKRITELVATVYSVTIYLNKPTTDGNTGEAHREESTMLKADLTSAATNHEGSWARVLDLMFRWTEGREPGKDDIKVEFVRDYDVRQAQPPQILALIALYDSGLLSSDTIWQRLIEGEILPENFDSKEEVERIKKDPTRKLGLEKTRTGAKTTPGVPRESSPDNGLEVDGNIEMKRKEDSPSNSSEEDSSE